MIYKNDQETNIFFDYIEKDGEYSDGEIMELGFDQFIIEDFLELEEKSAVISYRFHHTKRTQFDNNDTNKILQRIIQLDEIHENIVIALIKFINTHNLSKDANYDLFAEILITNFQVTNLFLIVLASLIITSEKMIVKSEFISSLLESDNIYTEEFWIFCICYRKIEMKFKSNSLIQIGMIETISIFLQNYGQNPTISIKMVQNVFKVLLSILEIESIPLFLKKYHNIIDAAHYFKEILVECCIFLLLFDEKDIILDSIPFSINL